MSARKVRVELSRRGDWDVELSDQDNRMSCETLEEVERVAQICAAYRQPCELVVCDAYHRVLHRELIDASADQATQAPQSPFANLLTILDTQDPPSINTSPQRQKPDHAPRTTSG
jgi:hypothetical protein